MKKDQKTDFLSTRVRYIPINDIRPNPQHHSNSHNPAVKNILYKFASSYEYFYHSSYSAKYKPWHAAKRGGFSYTGIRAYICRR